MSGIPQPVVRPVLPDRDDPLIKQFLQLAQRPDRLLPAAAAPVFRAAARITGDELGEQGGYRAQGPLDVRLVGSGRLACRLQADAQVSARRPEVPGDEHLAVVDHDRVRDDHRPGRGGLQPGVDVAQPPVRQR
jgi:hypothetical protein